MSQHSCFAEDNDNNLLAVFMGWDKSIQYYFMYIMGDDPEPIWSNLDLPDPFQQNLDLYKNVLKNMNLHIPQQMIQEVENDKKINAGNKIVDHDIVDGIYERSSSEKL